MRYGICTQAPIESYFKALEDVYIMSVANPPPYMKDQMTAKAITLIETSGLCPTALLEWNEFNPANKNWQELKAHFGEAYQLLITTGPGQKLLQQASNATTQLTLPGATVDDDDSITTITDVLGSVAMANNTNTQLVRDKISTLRGELSAI